MDLVLGTSKARWINGVLYWVLHDDTPGMAAQANDTVLFKSWEMASPPPKRYTFEEALVMMRQGKWMSPVFSCNQRYRRNGTAWENEYIYNHSSDKTSTLLMSHVDAMWEERP